MKKVKGLFNKIILVCILSLLFIVYNSVSIKTFANSNPDLGNSSSSNTYHGLDLSNLLPFREYAESQGYVFYDASTMDDFIENFHDIYQQAINLGVIVPIDNDILLYEPSLIQPCFKAGDNVDSDDDNGHQIIAREAYRIVQSEYPHIFDSLSGEFNDKGEFIGSEDQNTNYVTRYVNYPDIKGEFTKLFGDGNGFNYDHFYNAKNGGNYFNMSIPLTVIDDNNAKTRFIEHYNSAVSLWKSGNKIQSYKSLGQALHFAADLSTPHHVGDQLPQWITGPLAAAIATGGPLNPVVSVLALYIADMLLGHKAFEDTVDRNISDIIMLNKGKNESSWNISKDYSKMTLDEIVDNTVAIAAEQYPFMNIFSNHKNIAEVVVPNAIDVTIGILRKFAEEVQFDTTNLQNNEIRIDKIHWSISGSYSIPTTLKDRSVTKISSSAFANQTELSHITIPESVNTIGSFAFKDCSNLESITIEREEGTIIDLGYGVFDGCDSLEKIIIPKNKILEYKNHPNWSRYSNKMDYIGSFPSYNLSCISDVNTNDFVEPGTNLIYKLEVDCPKSYKFIATAVSSINFSLYSSGMLIVTDAQEMANNDRKATITRYLNPGTYYLSVNFQDNTVSGNIEMNLKPTYPNRGYPISYDTDEDALEHLHQISVGSFQNKFNYRNDEPSGFYELILTGIKPNGLSTYYPEGSITVYKDIDRNEIKDKFDLAGYFNKAKTDEHTNRLIIYLEAYEQIYIDINMTSNNFSSLVFNISSLEEGEINLFNFSEDSNTTIDIFHETTKGDYFKEIDIKQSGQFNVSTIYTGESYENILFVIARKYYNEDTNRYVTERKLIEFINNTNNSYSEVLNLEEGLYYIGYFNKSDEGSISVNFERIVTQSGSHVLETDPGLGTPSGSQINIIEMNNSEKSYLQTFITKHFTRIIYPNFNYDVPASRLKYDWYSSDEQIATVTPYGTVLGKNIGTVRIMAVLKENPSKVFVKEFTIIEDTDTERLFVNSTLTVKLSETDNGKFKLNLDEVNCPYPLYKEYDWTLFIAPQENIGVRIDEWGFITVTETGEFTLTGTYKKNPRVSIIIDIVIVP